MTLIIPRLTAANGDVINGVAHFVTDTKPTTRIGGAALVTGDHWYKSDDGTEWFWNGTYWLSERVYGNNTVVSGTGASSVFSSVNPTSTSLLFEYINWFGLTGAVHDGSNYFGLRFTGFGLTGGPVFRTLFANTSAIGSSAYYDLTYTNIVLDLTASPVLNTVGLSYYAIGSPTTAGIFSNFNWHFRNIAP